MRRSRVALFLTTVTAAGAIATLSASPVQADVGDGVGIPGLRAAASVVRDADGVPHIKARNTHDLFFLQGWQHAEDRLFQMDVTRRRASGTLAELLGSSALPSDVQLRTFGLRRSAERTMSVLSRKTRDDLRAYADGVNACIERNELPGQCASAQVTKVEPWSEVDSVLALKLVSFSLSFDLDIPPDDGRAGRRRGRTRRSNGGVRRSLPVRAVQPGLAGHRRHAAADQTGNADVTSPRRRLGCVGALARMAADYLKRAEQVPTIVDALNRDAERGRTRGSPAGATPMTRLVGSPRRHRSLRSGAGRPPESAGRKPGTLDGTRLPTRARGSRPFVNHVADQPLRITPFPHALRTGCHVRSSPFVIPVMTTNAGGTAMLERIVYTSVFVSDQDRALDFYTNVLGFEQRSDNPTPDGPRFLTVAVNGQDFQLVLWPGTPGQGQPVFGRIPAAYTIETGDCRKAYEELKSRGVKFDTGVLEYPWGYVAVFQDPDGNRLQLREGR